MEKIDILYNMVFKKTEEAKKMVMIGASSCYSCRYKELRTLLEEITILQNIDNLYKK